MVHQLIDEEALKVLRSKYALPPCPSMARGRLCECEPKRFTFRACVWMGYKEARDFFPAMAETLEKALAVVRAAEHVYALSGPIGQDSPMESLGKTLAPFYPEFGGPGT